MDSCLYWKSWALRSTAHGNGRQRRRFAVAAQFLDSRVNTLAFGVAIAVDTVAGIILFERAITRPRFWSDRIFVRQRRPYVRSHRSTGGNGRRADEDLVQLLVTISHKIAYILKSVKFNDNLDQSWMMFKSLNERIFMGFVGQRRLYFKVERRLWRNKRTQHTLF